MQTLTKMCSTIFNYKNKFECKTVITKHPVAEFKKNGFNNFSLYLMTGSTIMTFALHHFVESALKNVFDGAILFYHSLVIIFFFCLFYDAQA